MRSEPVWRGRVLPGRRQRTVRTLQVIYDQIPDIFGHENHKYIRLLLNL